MAKFDDKDKFTLMMVRAQLYGQATFLLIMIISVGVWAVYDTYFK